MNVFHLIAMTPQGGDSNPIYQFLPFVLIIFIFYFMIIRPQQKRQKERQKLLDSVKKGDKIVTVSGMHGTVVGVEDKTLLIQAAEGIKLKYDRTAIASVTREAGNEATPS